MYDVLSDKKIDKTYNGLFLENEFLKICVLPEMGGRIFQATDKTNNYEFFYRQHVIKPALIGMTGAWISGGVEWNIPHHHRASSFLPVDWKTIENPDGSKSVWVGETELRQRMKWSVELTVEPGRSYVKARTRIENRSPLIQSMLCWANVSVHCNPDYEVIFAPSVQHGTDHAKVRFCNWPMGKPGVDFRFWKNHTDQFRSVFAWDFENDFLAGYDHGREAGTVHVANHHVVTGKKFFLWGNHDRAKMWDQMLTDPWTDQQKKESLAGNDAQYPQYLELMVGAWSDNQPDYSWIGPGETREHVQYWYPIRGIGGVKAATIDAAVNLERVAQDKLKIGFCSSGTFKKARAFVWGNGKELLNREIDIDPGCPFIADCSVPKDCEDSRLTVFLQDADGKKLVEFQPQELTPEADPEIVKPTPAPKEIQTVEELFLAGQRIEQFHNARMNPMDYYEEALRRDPGDARTNTAVGLRYARQAKWALAEKHLRTAIARLDKNYTRLKDGEPHYLLGYVLEQQILDKLATEFPTGPGDIGGIIYGKTAQRELTKAADQYWKATWTTGYQSAAFFRLAQMACREAHFGKALELIDQSLKTNADNPKAQVVKAYILRRLNRTDEAQSLLNAVLVKNPLDLMAKIEQAALKQQAEGKNTSEYYRQALTDSQQADDLIKAQELLEVVADYQALGSPQALVPLYEASALGKPYSNNPLYRYYSCFNMTNINNTENFNTEANEKLKANVLNAVRSQESLDYCFPFRVEEIRLFEQAIKRNPKDATAWNLLGTLRYYLDQKPEGIVAWEESAKLAPNQGRVWRNLGFAYAQAGQINRAIEAYKTGLKHDTTDPRPFTELDILEAQKFVPAAERLAVLEANRETILKHDDATVRLIELYNQTGQYQKSIDILDSRHFHVWEGGRAIHDLFVDAHLLRGIQRRDAKQFDEAIADFEIAQTYPENLEVGRVIGGGQNAKIFYYLGTTQDAKGWETAAKKAFEQSADPVNANADLSHEITYFQIASMKKLGREDEARKLTEKFDKAVNGRISQADRADEFSKFGEDGTAQERRAKLFYLQGLVELAKDNSDEANRFFDESLKLNPNQIWPKVWRDSNK